MPSLTHPLASHLGQVVIEEPSFLSKEGIAYDIYT